LDGDPAPPTLGEDVPTAAALAAVAAVEVVGIYKILKRWISSIDADIMLIPFFVVGSYRCKVRLPRRVSR
jgi:uncharacterized membrane protein